MRWEMCPRMMALNIYDIIQKSFVDFAYEIIRTSEGI